MKKKRTRPTTWWIRSFLAIFFLNFLENAASNLPIESLYVINALSSRSSFSVSFPTYSIRDHLAEGSMASFQQGELIKVLFAHEASNLSASMLEQLSERKLEAQELEEQTTQLKEKVKGLEEQTTELTKQLPEGTLEVKELEEKNKELEGQQADLDSALVKAELSQLSEKEAKKSLKKIASTQLPQQEVKGAWLEQLASKQQLNFSILSISLDNFMVKYAAFQEREELYQSNFSASSFSASNLQISLAKSIQLPSLFSQSFMRMKENQLHQQAQAFGSRDPRACTGTCKSLCWQHNGSLLASQQKGQEKQLSQGLMQRVRQIQLCKDLLAEWLAALPAYSVEKQEPPPPAYSSGVASNRDEET